MGIFSGEVVFQEVEEIPDPQDEEGRCQPIGWWIVFGLRSMPKMWAGSCLSLDPRMDPPYGFGTSQEKELVFIDSGVLRIGTRQFEPREVALVQPQTDLSLRVSGQLRAYTLWQTNFYALWQRLRSLGLTDSGIAEGIAGGLQQVASKQLSEEDAFRTFVRANTAFRRLMRELHGELQDWEKSQL